MSKRRHQIDPPDPLALYERCQEVGDCLEWTERFSSNGYPYVCAPVIEPARRSWLKTLVRPLLYRAISGRSAPEGLHIRMGCGNRRCINFDHFRLLSRRSSGREAAASGSFSRPARLAAITVGARRGKNAKLDETKVAHIRSSAEPGYVLAEVYGVNKSLISRIRRGEAWRPAVRGASVFTWREAA